MNARKILTLDQIPSGEKCVITDVHGHGGFRHRILEMGFVKGQEVTVVRNAPLSDPIEYKILNSHISLRISEAKQIEVIEVDNYVPNKDEFFGTMTEAQRSAISNEMKIINVALLGNPNCGKTSFFNFATGLHEKTGNYGGVTVDSKLGVFKHKGYSINMIDLPGTYSITEFTPEEKYVRQSLVEEQPDVVLNILDASNLERNLFLTTQLIDMNYRMVVAVNMYDELEKSGNKFDYNYMGKMLGIPFVPTTAYKGIGIDDVMEAIIEVYEERSQITRHIHINYGNTIESAIDEIKGKIAENKSITDQYHARYLAIKMIENEKITHELLSSCSNYAEIVEVTDKQIKRIYSEYKKDMDTVIADAKYAFIRGALKETYQPSKEPHQDRSQKIDNILTNKWLGFPCLFLFMLIMFYVTFMVGGIFQNWLEAGVAWFGDKLGQLLPQGWFNDLVTDGIVAGVGSVIVFLPVIVLLFFFISIMEDTGYMARAAFIFDKLMHKIGLHGRSFIPLLTGFGCSVPAIMACRTLENRKDRIMTMLLIPFMSCTAKIPVYVIFIALLEKLNPNLEGFGFLMMFGVYLFGILIAILAALVMKKTAFKKAEEQFVMELPPYRIPSAHNVLIHMWSKSAQYLKKMGTVILLASVVIWGLNYFPQNNSQTRAIDAQISLCQGDETLSDEDKTLLVKQLENSKRVAQQEGSLIGYMGRAIEPVMRPLGFDDRMSICILTGFAAKEIVVSSMGILYGSGEEDGNEHLLQSFQNATYQNGKRAGNQIFTVPVTLAFMAFILLYSPCIASVVACRKESSRKWASVFFLYTTIIAWIVSFLIYQIGNLL